MVPIKALLTGLAGVSLCMANISGIVTDTGTTPIAGAIVKLEKGGQTATTEADGSFTLNGGTGITARTNQYHGFSATIHHGLLHVDLLEPSVVEASCYSLQGREISTMQKSMAAGANAIALADKGAGIFLYKVRAGKNEIILRGNSIDGGVDRTAQTDFTPSAHVLAKHATSSSAINDVISVIKAGYLNYRAVIYKSDTSGIKIKMIVCADSITDADGNVYHAVRIGNQVWTVENLRTTRYNDSLDIPFAADAGAWNIGTTTTAAFCYYNNMASTTVNYVLRVPVSPTAQDWQCPNFSKDFSSKTNFLFDLYVRSDSAAHVKIVPVLKVTSAYTWSPDSNDAIYTDSVVRGKWVTCSMPLSNFHASSLTAVNQVYFQITPTTSNNYSGVIYFDNIRVDTDTLFNFNSGWSLASLVRYRDAYSDKTGTKDVGIPFTVLTNADSVAKLGALYNWFAASSGKLAPAGWHVPDTTEWNTLKQYLVANGYNYDGTTDTTQTNKIAKALAAEVAWPIQTGIGSIGNDLTKNNKTVFSAIPVGFCNESEAFVGISDRSFWWSATGLNAAIGYYGGIWGGDTGLSIGYKNGGYGFPVRLVRNN